MLPKTKLRSLALLMFRLARSGGQALAERSRFCQKRVDFWALFCEKQSKSCEKGVLGHSLLTTPLCVAVTHHAFALSSRLASSRQQLSLSASTMHLPSLALTVQEQLDFALSVVGGDSSGGGATTSSGGGGATGGGGGEEQAELEEDDDDNDNDEALLGDEEAENDDDDDVAAVAGIGGLMVAEDEDEDAPKDTELGDDTRFPEQEEEEQQDQVELQQQEEEPVETALAALSAAVTALGPPAQDAGVVVLQEGVLLAGTALLRMKTEQPFLFASLEAASKTKDGREAQVEIARAYAETTARSLLMQNMLMPGVIENALTFIRAAIITDPRRAFRKLRGLRQARSTLVSVSVPGAAHYELQGRLYYYDIATLVKDSIELHSIRLQAGPLLLSSRDLCSEACALGRKPSRFLMDKIRDANPGLTPDDLEKVVVCKVYYQADKANARKVSVFPCRVSLSLFDERDGNAPLPLVALIPVMRWCGLLRGTSPVSMNDAPRERLGEALSLLQRTCFERLFANLAEVQGNLFKVRLNGEDRLVTIVYGGMFADMDERYVQAELVKALVVTKKYNPFYMKRSNLSEWRNYEEELVFTDDVQRAEAGVKSSREMLPLVKAGVWFKPDMFYLQFFVDVMHTFKGVAESVDSAIHHASAEFREHKAFGAAYGNSVIGIADADKLSTATADVARSYFPFAAGVAAFACLSLSNKRFTGQQGKALKSIAQLAVDVLDLLAWSVDPLVAVEMEKVKALTDRMCKCSDDLVAATKRTTESGVDYVSVVTPKFVEFVRVLPVFLQQAGCAVRYSCARLEGGHKKSNQDTANHTSGRADSARSVIETDHVREVVEAVRGLEANPEMKARPSSFYALTPHFALGLRKHHCGSREVLEDFLRCRVLGVCKRMFGSSDAELAWVNEACARAADAVEAAWNEPISGLVLGDRVSMELKSCGGSYVVFSDASTVLWEARSVRSDATALAYVDSARGGDEAESVEGLKREKRCANPWCCSSQRPGLGSSRRQKQFLGVPVSFMANSRGEHAAMLMDLGLVNKGDHVDYSKVFAFVTPLPRVRFVKASSLLGSRPLMRKPYSQPGPAAAADACISRLSLRAILSAFAAT